MTDRLITDRPFSIVVTVRFKLGKGQELLPYILDNATSAVRDEAGCQQFQVLNDAKDPDTFVFYEVYDSPTDLDFHRRQPHFVRYAEAIEDRLIDKSIRSCHVLKT